MCVQCIKKVKHKNVGFMKKLIMMSLIILSCTSCVTTLLAAGATAAVAGAAGGATMAATSHAVKRSLEKKLKNITTDNS